MRSHSLFTWIVCFGGLLAAQAASPVDERMRAVVQRHAEHCHAVHRDAAVAAAALQQAVRALVAAPSEATLQAARAKWIAARVPYAQLEALRGHGGPIDAVEPLLNAWPVDEAYIDAVVGRPGAGIVHDRKSFPVLSTPALELANERGGETNVSVGWHAIEFLLWGQDQDPKGPGQRPFTDFVDGVGADADRRRAYLELVTGRLVAHLQELATAWAPDADNFRRRFEREPRDALRRMLAGTLIHTTFELAGERLAVAYETQDQEQEHSCFSDNTGADLVNNQLGIVAVFDGGRGERKDADLLAYVRARDPAVATLLEQSLQKTLAALRAIPQPFDQAFRGADDAPGRVAFRAALQALEAQAEAIAIAGQLFGFDLPVRPAPGPGGR